MSVDHRSLRADAKAYERGFFEWLGESATASANVVVPLALELVPARSVVDVGCGEGAWLEAFARHGVGRILGIDGVHVDRTQLRIPPSAFVAHDLREPLALGERFDLVVSLEVAEHLPAASADAFVATLTSLGPVVLFSAAIPSQGGTAHVNEQWPEYWAERFARRGYRALDCIRPLVWDDPRVEVWYAQNILVFATEEAIAANERLRLAAQVPPRPLSIVHPRLFLGPRKVSAREFAGIVKATVFGPLKQHLSRRARRLRSRLAR